MQLGVLNIRKGLLQVVIPVLRLFPPRTGARLAASLGRMEYALNRPLRLRYDAAIERGARHFGTSWNTKTLGSDLAGNSVRWRTRDLLLDGLSNERAALAFRVEGREHLDAAYGQRKGVVLLFNHFGAFLMPAHWMVREGYPLRWFTERPRHISKLVERTFEGEGPLSQAKLFMSRKAGTNEGGTAIRRAMRILQAGLVVQIAGDVRGIGLRTASATFLGETYSFTTTWITLAARTQALVVPVFCSMEPDGSYRLEFLPALDVGREGNRPGEQARLVQWYMREIEQRVGRQPANSGEYFFWSHRDADWVHRVNTPAAGSGAPPSNKP
ncbi:MAG TPA: lysophospholipid acyltransferase family protein [Isosphaeraceae bacterium]|nr:lysophospholipid acyltransferase family protein [Isosphaeraceae bacterium]